MRVEPSTLVLRGCLRCPRPSPPPPALPIDCEASPASDATTSTYSGANASDSGANTALAGEGVSDGRRCGCLGGSCTCGRVAVAGNGAATLKAKKPGRAREPLAAEPLAEPDDAPREGKKTEEGELPEGWESAWDHGWKEVYYYNRSTGERTWSRPCAEDAKQSVPDEDEVLPDTLSIAVAELAHGHRGEAEAGHRKQSDTASAAGEPLSARSIRKVWMNLGLNSDSARPTDSDCERLHVLRRDRLYTSTTSAYTGTHVQVEDSCNTSHASKTAHAFIADTAQVPTKLLVGKDGAAIKSQATWEPVVGLGGAEWISWWQGLKEPKRQGCLANFASCKMFEAVIISVIITNGVLTICETDQEMNIHKVAANSATAHDSLLAVYEKMAVPEYVFLSVYCVELVVKFWVHRWYYFINKDAAWNIFDFCLICAALFENIALAGQERIITPLRILRLLKISRLLTMLRAVRFFKELRLMMASLVGCACPTLLWSIIMLAFIVHIFGLIFVRRMTQFLDQNASDEGVRGDVLTMFGSVGDAMLTLWKSSTGGDDWGVAFDIVRQTGPWNAALFVFFVFFFQGAIFNVMTGIFVEKAMHAATPTMEEQVQQKYKADFEDAEELFKVCQALDDDNSGDISFEEFMDYMEHSSKFASWFELHGLNIKNAQSFFRMLATVNGKDSLDVSTFVSSCMQLRGYASALDLHVLVFEMKLMSQSQHKFQDDCRALLDKLQQPGNALSHHPEKHGPRHRNRLKSD